MKKYIYALVPVLLLAVIVITACALPTALPAATATPEDPPTETASPTAPATATSTASATPTVTLTPSQTPLPTATLAPSATPFALNTHPELDRYIYVDQMVQRMYIFESGVLTRTMLISTGSPEPATYTPAWEGKVGWYVGTFFSFGTYQDDAWFLFEDGFLIHGQPYLYDKAGNKVYQFGDVQGVRPASHGCIRLLPDDIVWLTKWDPEGVLITISDPYIDYWQAKLKAAAQTSSAEPGADEATATPTSAPD